MLQKCRSMFEAIRRPHDFCCNVVIGEYEDWVRIGKRAYKCFYNSAVVW